MKNDLSHSKPISCEEAIKHIFDYIDKQLSSSTLQELEHHLETCRHCYDRVEFEKMIKTRLKNLHHQINSDDLMKKINLLIDSF